MQKIQPTPWAYILHTPIQLFFRKTTWLWHLLNVLAIEAWTNLPPPSGSEQNSTHLLGKKTPFPASIKWALPNKFTTLLEEPSFRNASLLFPSQTIWAPPPSRSVLSPLQLVALSNYMGSSPPPVEVCSLHCSLWHSQTVWPPPPVEVYSLHCSLWHSQTIWAPPPVEVCSPHSSLWHSQTIWAPPPVEVCSPHSSLWHSQTICAPPPVEVCSLHRSLWHRVVLSHVHTQASQLSLQVFSHFVPLTPSYLHIKPWLLSTV